MSTQEDLVRSCLLDLIGELTEDQEDPAAMVATARMVQEQLPAVLQQVVDNARTYGASWQDVATALKLKTGSSAHWHYGRGRADDEEAPETKQERLQSLRRRAAATRGGLPSIELPGLSRQDAAAALGCDPKTLVRRAANRDGVRVEDTLSRHGKTVRRYFLL
jgi:hypothetical protein